MAFPPREVALLEALAHPYINFLYDTVVLDDRIHMILEYVSGRELCDIVEDEALSEKKARQYFRQMLVAVKYMHEAVGSVYLSLI